MAALAASFSKSLSAGKHHVEERIKYVEVPQVKYVEIPKVHIGEVPSFFHNSTHKQEGVDSELRQATGWRPE